MDRRGVAAIALRRPANFAWYTGGADSRVDRVVAEVFADIQRFYGDAGYPDEWRLHHQGGLTGYGSRELIATPTTDHVIAPGQAFAWNPSITGAKAEETFVLTETGPEVVAGSLALAEAAA